DPVMKYGIYLRGIGLAYGRAIAVDDAKNTYVTGESFPAPYEMAENSYGISGDGTDVVVAKINADGTAPVYVTYFGGSGDELGKGIVVDPTGHAYVTGQTDSPDFPVDLMFALQESPGGGNDAFAVKLTPDGSELVFSTYLGTTKDDSGNAITLDNAGDLYLTGSTWSPNFPAVGFPHNSTFGGTQDAFILKMKGDGSGIIFSEFIGGSLIEAGNGVAVDSDGNSYVTGITYSTNFPVRNAVQASLAGDLWTDAFVTKVSPAGDSLIFSTYLGGPLSDTGNAIAVDSQGRAHVTGSTISGVFPTKQPFQAYIGGCHDAFYTRYSPDGSSLEYSTYIGGVNNEEGNGIAVDACGTTYITGFTQSYDLPVINPVQQYFSGGIDDAFVAKFVPWDTTPEYITFLGGNGKDVGAGIAISPRACVDCAGEKTCAHVTGYTDSTDFPSSDPYPALFEPRGQGGFIVALCDEHESPAPPIANFTYLSECPNPLYVEFTDTSLNNPTQWFWNFGDGTTSPLQHPIHTYAAYGDYNVTLTVSNICGSFTITRNLNITECPPPVNPPIANFTYHFECPNPLYVEFTDTTLNNPTQWFWSFGDGATSTLQNLNHTYSAYGGYNVTLTASNEGGSNSTTRIFCINECPPPVDPPVANFTYLSECPTPLYVQFTDTSLNNPTQWFWNFGDGTTSTFQNPNHTYSAYGGYNVTLTVSNSAGTNATTQIICLYVCPPPVYPPVANFTYLSECPTPLYVQF
ncbi:MAG: SBBP repeat-containing protein, partial [Methanolinea sp.]|nr:SBBP repeat-containing protein [Methanolinea sp.]